MRTRRTVLATGATLLGTALAGCMGNEGQKAYDQAIAKLGENEEEHGGYVASGEVPEEFDPAAIRENATAAEDHLDTAAEAWGEDQQAKIEAGHTLVALHRAVADAGKAQATYEECIDTPARQWHNQEYEAAATEVETCRDASETLATRYEAVVAVGSADSTVLEEMGSPLQFTAASQFPYNDTAAAAVRAFQDGFETFLAGSVEGSTGREAWHQTEWQTAIDELQPAVSKFESAVKTFDSVPEDPPLSDKLSHLYTEFRCFAENHVEAGTLFIESANAALSGDLDTAESKGEAAQNARGGC
jgi:hypothetical protein